MKLNFESKYLIVRGNYTYINNFYTHGRWVRFNISLLSKGEKRKLCMGVVNKSIHTKLFTICLANAKHEHP